MPPKYYAVHQGAKTGIYTTWAECKPNVKDTAVRAIYKGFETLEEAQDFVTHGFKKKNPARAGNEWRDFVPPAPPKATVGANFDAAIAAAFGDWEAFVAPPVPAYEVKGAPVTITLPEGVLLDINLPPKPTYEYQIWTDGSAEFEKAAGYAFVIVKEGKIVREGGGKVAEPPYSAPQAEVQAVQAALYVFQTEFAVDRKPSFIICSDSEFLTNTINKWGPGRTKDDWKGKKYAAELCMFLNFFKAWKVDSTCAVEHVSAHIGLEFNERADRLAKAYKDAPVPAALPTAPAAYIAPAALPTAPAAYIAPAALPTAPAAYIAPAALPTAPAAYIAPAALPTAPAAYIAPAALPIAPAASNV